MENNHEQTCIDRCEKTTQTTATKTAIRLASEGKLVGIFPEGRINETDQFADMISE